VGYPPDLDDVGHVFTTDAGYKDGPAVEFLFRILEQSNFSITVANFSTSEASLERYSPSNGYTACVHDVSLGKVDMCVGTHNSQLVHYFYTSYTHIHRSFLSYTCITALF